VNERQFLSAYRESSVIAIAVCVSARFVTNVIENVLNPSYIYTTKRKMLVVYLTDR
jgi:hypothetical protein